MKYRLISIESNPITLRNFPKTLSNGGVSWAYYQRLEPGKWYETSDPAQIGYLKMRKETVRYNAGLENALKSIGAEYKVITCKQCGGKVKKIEYSNIEVSE